MCTILIILDLIHLTILGKEYKLYNFVRVLCYLYRAIGLVLDFIHRLVRARQKIPQRFGDWICLRNLVGFEVLHVKEEGESRINAQKL
jgi:hypothetical protein